MQNRHLELRLYVLATEHLILEALRRLQSRERVTYADIHGELRCDVCDKTIERAIVRLEQKGFIIVAGAGKKAGRRYEVKAG